MRWVFVEGISRIGVCYSRIFEQKSDDVTTTTREEVEAVNVRNIANLIICGAGLANSSGYKHPEA
jgi:hypothetical protein